jgi:hypothetical protein
MSTYIVGQLEVRRGNTGWEGRELEDEVLYQSYDFFGCFFGVRNCGDWEPLFPERGLPKDAAESTRVKRDAAGWDWAHDSFFACDELAAADTSRAAGDDPVRVEDAWRVDLFRVTDGGREVLEEENVSFYDDIGAVFAGADGEPDPGAGRVLCTDGVFRRGDQLWRCRKRTVADVMADYSALFELLAEESVIHRPENVRVIVWFWY